MDQQDEDFEAFLRGFRPRKPKALPRRRRTVVATALASVIAVAAITAVALRDSAVAPTSMKSVSADLSNATDARKSTPAAPANPPGPGPGPATPNRSVSTPAAANPPDPGPAAPNRSVSTTAGAGSRRVRVGGAVKPPVTLFHVSPEYPEAARAAGIAGVVILEIVVGEDGSVIETRVLRSIPELDQAAIDAVTQWKFEPKVLNGEPVEVEMVVTINFTLPEN